MAVVLQRISGCFIIFGFQDFEVIFEYFARSKLYELRVVDYQDRRFAGTGFGHLSFETLAYNGQMSAQTDKPLTIRCLGGNLPGKQLIPVTLGRRNFIERQQFVHERCDCGDKFEDGWQALIYAQRGVSVG